MNRKEAMKFLALIKVAYPTAYRDMDEESIEATINMWEKTFSNMPYRIMELAFEHFRRVSKYPPTVAEMYEEFRSLYYRAVTDDLMATDDGYTALAQKAQWIMKYTSSFRGDYQPMIDYQMISDSDLKLLPDSSVKKLTKA